VGGGVGLDWEVCHRRGKMKGKSVGKSRANEGLENSSGRFAREIRKSAGPVGEKGPGGEAGEKGWRKGGRPRQG